jgi:hypothetical protein
MKSVPQNAVTGFRLKTYILFTAKDLTNQRLISRSLRSEVPTRYSLTSTGIYVQSQFKL